MSPMYVLFYKHSLTLFLPATGASEGEKARAGIWDLGLVDVYFIPVREGRTMSTVFI